MSELTRVWNAVTPDEILSSNRRIATNHPKREGDVFLGVVSQETRRTWVAYEYLETRSEEERLFARTRAGNEEEARLHLEVAQRFSGLSHIFLAMFWAQAREDVGGEAWAANQPMGIRPGWELVQIKWPPPSAVGISLQAGPEGP